MRFESNLAGKPASEQRFMVSFGLISGLAVLIFLRELLDRLEMVSGRLWSFSASAEVALTFLLLVTILATFPQLLRELSKRRNSALHAQRALSQIESLFNMTDMLQSALGHADANAVLRASASSLLPGFGGALYIFNNSGDRLELSTSWHWPEAIALGETISPSQCWAIKRGKNHLNLAGDNALCCEHQQCCVTTMEIPMMARGEIYGLLLVQRDGAQAQSELALIAPAANALADAMSLSLSNLALRERLRSQALRDPLTGLYNRRYMEDSFERLAGQSTSSGSPLSVIMIDLDHFKKLNDDHGHSMGDAMLAETAAAILGAVGPRDVACRYGGEELVLLVPDCGLEEGIARAELLRSKIERLSEIHGVSISASIGVAAIGETSNAQNALSHADKALYKAKREGRNRVVAASPTRRQLSATPIPKAA